MSNLHTCQGGLVGAERWTLTIDERVMAGLAFEASPSNFFHRR
jgi:hypothetical protein